MCAALATFTEFQLKNSFDPVALHRTAQRFSVERFKRELLELLAA